MADTVNWLLKAALAGAGVVMVMDCVTLAEHNGLLVPPLLPLHDHDHGPGPDGIAETVPLEQRLVVGAVG